MEHFSFIPDEDGLYKISVYYYDDNGENPHNDGRNIDLYDDEYNFLNSFRSGGTQHLSGGKKYCFDINSDRYIMVKRLFFKNYMVR